jgi:hypothetical protein
LDAQWLTCMSPNSPIDLSHMSLFQCLSPSKKVHLGTLLLFPLFVFVTVVLQNHFQEQE